MELLTAAQMRAIEQAAIASGEVTGLDLMERAGRGVVEAIFEWRPDLAEGERSAVVLCGPGNNGGDGFVVARLLRERGWAVEVFLYGDEAKLPPDAATNAQRWTEPSHPIDDDALEQISVKADLFVDALFGTGLHRSIERPLYASLKRVMKNGWMSSRTVSIDAPSGLCLDSGRYLKTEWSQDIWADLTVTFHKPKHGHYLADGPMGCGRLVVVDIGLAGMNAHFSANDTVTYVKSPGQVLDKVSGIGGNIAFPSANHKYTHGHALVLSGGMGRTGAVRLAARGALRIGAGLVTVAAPRSSMMENATHLTAIMLREMGGADGLAEMLADERINAVCLGPGLGVNEETRELVAVACGHKDSLSRPLSRGLLEQRAPNEGGPASGAGQRKFRSVVIDADALTSFADDPPALFALLHGKCVLTPHEGEFGRLFPDILEKLKAPATTGPAYSKVDATREAAARAGCVVLFKGADTVIADPSGRTSINSAHYERAAPWLATAGSGDVLAGMITGLLARGLDAMSAAESAAWLHVECGRHLGPGLIAEDIPEALPTILKRVLGWTAPPDHETA